MSAGKSAVLRWAFFTLVLSLLQLWVLIAFRFFREDALGIRQVLLDGGLIFFANSVAMDVLARRWDEFKILAKTRGGVEVSRDGMLLYGMFLPALVLVIAVVMYCALLSKNPPSERIVWGELILTLIALTASLGHMLTFARRFELDGAAKKVQDGGGRAEGVAP